MLRNIMRQMGMLPREQQAQAADPVPEQTIRIKQWQDSAGAYHTEAYDEAGLELESKYALTRFGAWMHSIRVPRKARRVLRNATVNPRYGGWQHTGDYLEPKKREWETKV